MALRPVLLATLALPVLVACSTGRCMDELSIRPQASRSGGTIAAGADLSFRFGDCLAEKEIEAAERIKTAVADAFERFARGERSEERDNEHVDAARRALEQAIDALRPDEVGSRNPKREVERPEVFARLETVCERIERELLLAPR